MEKIYLVIYTLFFPRFLYFEIGEPSDLLDANLNSKINTQYTEKIVPLILLSDNFSSSSIEAEAPISNSVDDRKEHAERQIYPINRDYPKAIGINSLKTELAKLDPSASPEKTYKTLNRVGIKMIFIEQINMNKYLTLDLNETVVNFINCSYQNHRGNIKLVDNKVDLMYNKGKIYKYLPKNIGIHKLAFEIHSASCHLNERSSKTR